VVEVLGGRGASLAPDLLDGPLHSIPNVLILIL
jgi:hypothetical protein